jgi:hypothetical protein
MRLERCGGIGEVQGFYRRASRPRPSSNMKRITTTIKREWLDKIVAGTKKVEYREIKPYWTERFDGIEFPFELRLINGMSKKAPEATLLISRITTVLPTNEYALHIAKVLSTKNL